MGIKKHLRYASYIARHKWFVFVECARRGLIWRGIVHDWHKLLPEEWVPCAEHFYGEPVTLRDIDMGTGQEFEKGEDGKTYLGKAPNPVYVARCDSAREYIRTNAPDALDIAFDLAWLRHQKRADHHWQWWLLHQDGGDIRPMEMSGAARLEMICDWIGASRAQGYGGIEGVREWYEKNKDKMTLHWRTRRWVEEYLRPMKGQSDGNEDGKGGPYRC
jgi:hypothetical protein